MKASDRPLSDFPKHKDIKRSHFRPSELIEFVVKIVVFATLLGGFVLVNYLFFPQESSQLCDKSCSKL